MAWDASLGCRTKDGENFLGGLGGFELLAVILVAQEARDGGKQQQVLLKLALRREKQQTERDGLVVECLEIDARQSAEDSHHVLNARHTRMGQGDAITDARAF